MFSFLRRHRTFLLSFMGLCILLLTLFSAGTGFIGNSPSDPILKVNGKKITRASYDRLFNQASKQSSNMTPEQRNQLEAEVVQELIRQEVFYQEAQRYGIRVSDEELLMLLASQPVFQHEGRFVPELYRQTVQQAFGMPDHVFEDLQVRDLSINKLNRLMASSVHIPDSMVTAGLPQRIAVETDKAKKKSLQENPEEFREELRAREANVVFADWVAQLNANLKVEPISEDLKKKLGRTQ